MCGFVTADSPQAYQQVFGVVNRVLCTNCAIAGKFALQLDFCLLNLVDLAIRSPFIGQKLHAEQCGSSGKGTPEACQSRNKPNRCC